MNYITYDIETIANCFVVVFKGHKSKKYKVFTISKDLGINQYWELRKFLDDFKDFVFVGYNNLGFDSQIIEGILDGLDYAEGIKQLANSIIEGADTIPEWKLRTKQLDVYKLSYFDSMVRRTSLKALQINLRWKNCQEMPIHHDTKLTSQNQLQEVIDYCKNDVDSTEKYFDSIQGEIQLRKDLSKKYKVGLINSSNTEIAKKIFKKEYTRITGFDKFNEIRIPRKKRVYFKDVIHPFIKFETKQFNDLLEYFKERHSDNFRPIDKIIRGKNTEGNWALKLTYALGGLHSVNEYEIYKSDDNFEIIDQDFSSYYILLMLFFEIYPEQLGSDFLKVLKDIVDQRIKAKKEGDTLTASAMKIMVLSLYGLMGNEYFYGYSSELIYRVTVNGQLIISMLIERLIKENIRCFMVNTDGSSWLVEKDKVDLFYQICNDFTKEIKGDIEYVNYKKCIFQSVNDYLIETESGKKKKKGEKLPLIMVT